jgi:hypothetical protein
MKTITQKFEDELEAAALVSAREIHTFLTTRRSSDPDRLKRVHVAVQTVGDFTRFRASQNNLVSMMLMAARQAGVSSDVTLEIAKARGLLPSSAVADARKEKA